MWGRFLCWIGWHQWYYCHNDIFPKTWKMGDRICERCLKREQRYIFSEWERTK